VTGFDAFAAPGAAGLADLERVDFTAGGVCVSSPALVESDVLRIASVLASAGEAIRGRPAADIASVLGRVGARFTDDRDPIRRRALELLPDTSGLSGPMAREVLAGMARDWTEPALLALLRADLGDPAVLDRFTSVAGRRVMAVGPRLCVQIVAGSVPGVGVSALLRSLLVKAPTLIKPGRGDVVLPVLFAEALRAEDPALADTLGVVYWPGGSETLERAAVSAAEVVVAYGSDRTVAALRDLCPATTRLVGYHHRLSVGAVGRLALTESAIERTADEVARSVAVFDQRGCVSPHVILVDASGDIGPELFARRLGAAFERLEASLPSGRLEIEEAAALHQLRGTAELLAATGAGELVHGGASGTWTVLFEQRGGALEPAVGRVVRVRSFRHVSEVVALLEPVGAHLQTLGVAGFGDMLEALAAACGRIGVTRVAGFESVPYPPARWYHDGRPPIGELVRWVEVEGGESPRIESDPMTRPIR
jgi:hypothetical protein